MPKVIRKRKSEEKKSLNALPDSEYWVTQEGKKLYPNEFEDSHLVNTIRFLLRQGKERRLDEAVRKCEEFLKTGHYGNIPNERYYNHFTGDVNRFMDKSLPLQKWLMEKSKIFMLLVEEAKYRGLDYSEENETQTKTLKAKYTYNHLVFGA